MRVEGRNTAIQSLLVVKEMSNRSRFRLAAVTSLLHFPEFKVFSRPRWTGTGCLKMSKRTTQQSKVGLRRARASAHTWASFLEDPSVQGCRN